MELLEALISPQSQASVASILLMTGGNGTSQAPSSYVVAGLADARVYLVKTNLSTSTNPNGALLRAQFATQDTTTGLLNESVDFLRLLWEAGVTRSGTFSLTYRRSDGSGLPDNVCADGDTATLTVVVVHAADGQLVRPGVNAVLVGDGFDPARYDLTAVTAGQQVEYMTSGSESLADIVANYRIELTTLVDAAADATIATLDVTGIVHQVRGPLQGPPQG